MVEQLAEEVARALGLVDARGAPLRLQEDDARARATFRRALRTALDATRPRADAPSLGEATGTLERALGGPPRAVRRALAELSELVSLAAYARSKRAERARVLAALLVVLDLDGPLGITRAPGAEETLRATRREIERRLAR